MTLVGLVYAVTLTKMLWRPELLTELELKAPSKHGLRRVLFHDVAPVTRELLGKERISWLRGLPMRWSGHDLTVLHASPDNLWRAPLADAPDSELLEVYGGLESEAVVYGHITAPSFANSDAQPSLTAGAWALIMMETSVPGTPLSQTER